MKTSESCFVSIEFNFQFYCLNGKLWRIYVEKNGREKNKQKRDVTQVMSFVQYCDNEDI